MDEWMDGRKRGPGGFLEGFIVIIIYGPAWKGVVLLCTLKRKLSFNTVLYSPPKDWLPCALSTRTAYTIRTVKK